MPINDPCQIIDIHLARRTCNRSRVLRARRPNNVRQSDLCVMLDGKADLLNKWPKVIPFTRPKTRLFPGYIPDFFVWQTF